VCKSYGNAERLFYIHSGELFMDRTWSYIRGELADSHGKCLGHVYAHCYQYTDRMYQYLYGIGECKCGGPHHHHGKFPNHYLYQHTGYHLGKFHNKRSYVSVVFGRYNTYISHNNGNCSGKLYLNGNGSG
jgi:hypothetical protein